MADGSIRQSLPERLGRGRSLCSLPPCSLLVCWPVGSFGLRLSFSSLLDRRPFASLRPPLANSIVCVHDPLRPPRAQLTQPWPIVRPKTIFITITSTPQTHTPSPPPALHQNTHPPAGTAVHMVCSPSSSHPSNHSPISSRIKITTLNGMRSLPNPTRAAMLAPKRISTPNTR